MKYQLPFAALALLALLPVSLPGCPCNDKSDEALCRLLEDLTDLAYGYDRMEELEHEPPCIEPLVCLPGSAFGGCLRVEENGYFDRDRQIPNSGTLNYPRAWYGDLGLASSGAACIGDQALRFRTTRPYFATTNYDSRSSQIYQVIDYNAVMPPFPNSGYRYPLVRVQAAISIVVQTEKDRQFGLRINTYEGDIRTFPQDGSHRFDMEDISSATATYTLTDTFEQTYFYDDDGPEWQRIYLEGLIPPTTDFFAVILEAYEDEDNDTDCPNNLVICEFPARPVIDFVQITLSTPNQAPVAVDDHVQTRADQSIEIHPLLNDLDYTSRLDVNSLTITQHPAAGTAEIIRPGIIQYTPSDTNSEEIRIITYTVSDEEGLVSNEGRIIIRVLPGMNRPPVAVADSVTTPQGTPIEIDVLANDFDPDGDPITIIASSPNTAEGGTTEVINNGQAVRYTPETGFTGTDTFNYVIADSQGSSSMETPVTVVVAGTNSAPEVTDPINDFSVNVDPPGSCSFDLDDHFTDPDGDTLFYGFTVSSNAVTVAINGSVITITGYFFSEMPVTVTVIAQDTGSLNVSDTFEVNAALATDCAGNSAAP